MVYQKSKTVLNKYRKRNVVSNNKGANSLWIPFVWNTQLFLIRDVKRFLWFSNNVD